MPDAVPSRPSQAFLVWQIFFLVFGCVFMIVLMSSVIITFTLPEAYASRARLKIASSSPQYAGYDPTLVQTELGIIQSEVILDKVIEALDLNEVWRRKYNFEGKFKTAETRAALKHMLELRQVTNTSLADIIVYSDDKQEAARLANTIAETYQYYREDARNLLAKKTALEVAQEWNAQGRKFDSDEARIAEIAVEVNKRTGGGQIAVQIIEHGEPGARPVRPNKPLNIALGIICGAFFGGVLGGIAAFLVSRQQVLRRTIPPPVPQAIHSKY